MYEYTLTIFDSTGNAKLNERFNAENDAVAKQIGEQKLTDHNFIEQTHRLTRSGKLLLFHQ